MSVREVLDLGERCFAAAGFSRGPARASAEAVWWAEAYRGTGLTTLHDLLDDLPNLDREQLERCGRDSEFDVIDGHGQPSIVSARSALDLACARAERYGIGVTCVSVAAGDNTLSTLGHLTFKAAERGLPAVVTYADGGTGGAMLGGPDRPRPLLAEAEFNGVPESHAALADAVAMGLCEQQDEPLVQALFDTDCEDQYGSGDARLLDRLLWQATKPADNPQSEGESSFVVVCTDPTHPQNSGSVGGVVEQFIDERANERCTTVFEPEDIAARGETLLREGVEVDRDVWEDLFDYGDGIFAPPFEGSEMDAGFDLS